MKKNHALKAIGIDSTELAMIITGADGKELSPYGGKHKLWRIKTGKEKWEPRSSANFGSRMKPMIADWYADDKELELRETDIMQHQEMKNVIDSTDRLIYSADRFIQTAAIKTVHFTQFEQWGDAGTDDVPEHYFIQCQQHIATRKPEEMRCAVLALMDRDRKDYYVDFDEELWAALAYESEKFWHDHVLADVEPAYDNADDAVDWLAKYSKNRAGAGLLDADEATVKIMLHYAGLLLDADALESEINKSKATLMDICGEYDGLVMDGGAKITWKQGKDGKSTSWKDVANKLAEKLSPQALESAIAGNSKIKKGARSWRPTSLKNSAKK